MRGARLPDDGRHDEGIALGVAVARRHAHVERRAAPRLSRDLEHGAVRRRRSRRRCSRRSRGGRRRRRDPRPRPRRARTGPRPARRRIEAHGADLRCGVGGPGARRGLALSPARRDRRPGLDARDVVAPAARGRESGRTRARRRPISPSEHRRPAHRHPPRDTRAAATHRRGGPRGTAPGELDRSILAPGLRVDAAVRPATRAVHDRRCPRW